MLSKLLVICSEPVFIVSLSVLLDYESTDDAVCRGASVVFTCTTVGATGFLRWMDSSNNLVIFDSTNIIGDTGTLGDITLNLTHIETVSGATIYTSTATITNITQDTTMKCSDGIPLLSRTVKIRSKFLENYDWF